MGQVNSAINELGQYLSMWVMWLIIDKDTVLSNKLFYDRDGKAQLL